MSKKKYFILVIITSLLFSQFSLGSLGSNITRATTFSSEVIIATDTTWSKANNPYVLNESNVVIRRGITLTIEPGVIIKLAKGSIYVSDGNLIANGTAQEPIIFTSINDDARGGDTNSGSSLQPAPGDWGDIEAWDGGYLTLNNVQINYAGYYAGAFQVRNNIFQANTANAASGMPVISLYNASAQIDNSEISKNSYGLYIDNFDMVSNFAMHNSKIYNNGGMAFEYYNDREIDITNNWWGDNSGPYHSALNPDGKGEEVYGNAIFDPWIGKKAGNSNILFLPGLEASRLYQQGMIFENQLWEPNRSADVEKLFLDNNGKSVNGGIYTRDVLDEANILPLGQKNIYKSFINDLEKWKNEEKIITDYSAVPYDWRFSLNDILSSGIKTGDNIAYDQATDDPYIIAELKRLAQSSKTHKVTIIAHSNGGLLTKALVNKLGVEAENLIDKIVFVAVPQTGTPQAVGGLLHGFDQGLPNDQIDPFLTPQIARRLAVNMSSAYHLLPSESYFVNDGNVINTPVITFQPGNLTNVYINRYGNALTDAVKLNAFLRDNFAKVPATSDNLEQPIQLNNSLLTYAENIHQTIDSNWQIPQSIKVYQIAGFGKETLSGIKYWTGQECAIAVQDRCLSYRNKIQYSPDLVIDGDGTVVAPSALAISNNQSNTTRWWVDLEDYNNLFTIERKHADILEVLQLRNFIKNNIITESTTELPTYISSSTPAYSTVHRLSYILHSPLSLSAHDNSGNEISAATSTISGARYIRFGEVQYLSIPAETVHTLELDGTGTGSFTLEIQEKDNNTIVASSIFAALPCSTSTKVTMLVANGSIQSAGPLKVDYDGDGNVDYDLNPKLNETVTASFDQTPPEAKIFFDTNTNSIKVEGFDENPTTVTYSKITTSKKDHKQKETIIKADIVDQAGNITRVTYLEKPSNQNRSNIEIDSISYNGAVSNFHNTMVTYKWSKKANNYKMMASYIKTATSNIESHYLLKKNTTIVMTKANELDDRDEDDDCESRLIKKKMPGLVIPGITTNQGKINIYY